MTNYFKGCPSDTIPDQTNKLIGDDDGPQYFILNYLAQGSWGKVYRAVEISRPNVFYAVKCINRTPMSDFYRGMIRREVLLHLSCAEASRRVLQMHDIIEVDNDDLDLLYLVMEYCPDGDLMNLINGPPKSPEPFVSPFRFDDELIRSIFLQAIDAVADCHSIGVYHRDLKPENFLCRKDGSIALGDFGFATKKVVTKDFNQGSEPYMSPEIISTFNSRSIVSPAADVWALGIILLNMIAQCHPWSRASLTDTDYIPYLLQSRYYFHKKHLVSEEVNAILARVFTKHPEKRISIDEFRDRIANVKTFYSPEAATRCSSHMTGRCTSSEPPSCFDTSSSLDSEEEEHLVELRVMNPDITCSEFVNAAPMPPSLPSSAIGVSIGRDDMFISEFDDDSFLNVPLDEDSPSEYSSDSDSEGPVTPITPETQAADPAVLHATGFMEPGSFKLDGSTSLKYKRLSEPPSTLRRSTKAPDEGRHLNRSSCDSALRDVFRNLVRSVAT